MSHRPLSLLVLFGLTLATAFAEDAPTPQTPPAPPVTRNFRRFTFEAGGGIGIGRGDVGRFVGGSYSATGGAGINLSRMFGFDAEYLYYGLPFKDSVIRNQFLLPGAGGNVQAGLLNGTVTWPRSGRWTLYGIYGVGFYHRSVSNHKETVLAGTPCQPSWRWWDLTCTTGPGVPVLSFDQVIADHSKDAGGFNFGGGFTWRLNRFHGSKLYVEGRYHRAYHSDGQTTFIPIIIGLRW